MAKREEMRQHGWLPVDVSLTTRELARMITRAGLLFEHLPDGEFDPMLGLHRRGRHLRRHRRRDGGGAAHRGGGRDQRRDEAPGVQ